MFHPGQHAAQIRAVTVTDETDALGVHIRSGGEQIDGAPHVDDDADDPIMIGDFAFRAEVIIEQ